MLHPWYNPSSVTHARSPSHALILHPFDARARLPRARTQGPLSPPADPAGPAGPSAPQSATSASSTLSGCTRRAAGVVFDKEHADRAVATRYPRLCVTEIGIATFGEQRVAVMSNSAGTPDDPGRWCGRSRRRSVPGRRRYKKPRGLRRGEHWLRRQHAADGGDRYLTDVVFGNLHGMLTVHTQQLTTVGDNRSRS